MSILMVLHVLVCIFLVIVILLQPGKSDAGIGFGSSSQSIFGSKGAGNFLTKTTGTCAFLFLVTSFILTKGRMVEERGIEIPADKNTTAPVAPAAPGAPAAPQAPAAAPAAKAPAKATDTKK